MDHMDPKYLTDYESEEIKKFKHVFYIGHKAHQRKVSPKFNVACEG